MNWEDIKGTVSRAAPLVGSLLGGPAGGAIGSLVASALGVEGTPEAVANAVKNDPDAALKLRELELNNSQKLKEIQFQTLDAELKDKQSAREAHKHSKMPAIITCVMTVLALMYGLGLFFIEFPETNRDMVNYFGGQLIALWFASVVYWTGTTRGSEDKTRLINNKAIL